MNYSRWKLIILYDNENNEKKNHKKSVGYERIKDNEERISKLT